MLVASLRIAPDASGQVLPVVQSIADAFGRAFSLGLFGAAALSAPIEVRIGAPARVDIDIPAERCPPAMLRILWGMIEWRRTADALPLEWLGAWQDGMKLDLESRTLPLLSGLDRRYQLVRPMFVGFGDSLVVLVESARPLDDLQVELLEEGLHMWAALMLGGLPPEGAAPGESAIGATSGHRVTPATYQWYVEGLAADSASIDLLVNFLDAQDAPLALRAVEIES